MPHILYGKSDGYNARVICERPNWKNCPEHKHLTDKMPKGFLSQNDAVVSSVESSSYGSEEAAISGVNQAYYDYKAKEVKRERLRNALNIAAGAGTAGLLGVAITTGIFVFALPLFAWAGWNFNNMFSKK